jgi:hypothetical protein
MNNNYQVAYKVYDIDYSFLIKNYLNQELWHKEWILLCYKQYRFTIALGSINCENDTITFKMRLYGADYYYCSSICEYVVYHYKNTSIKILKQQIAGAMIECIKSAEEYGLKTTSEYEKICECADLEEQKLREIAEQKLDDEGINNTDIRDTYIDIFVSNNSTTDFKKSRYLARMQYKYYSDLYLIVCKSLPDCTRSGEIMDALKSVGNIDDLLQEVDSFMKKMETEEYVDEMTYELEAV